MNAKIILGIISFVAAVLTAYPFTVWYIGRERDNKALMKKYKWKMLIGISISIALYIISVKI